MRRPVIVLVFAALLLVGAGCGGGDDDASGDTDAAVLTDTTVTEDTTTVETDTSDLGALASGECLELISAAAALSQALATAGAAGGDVDEASGLFDRLVDRAPDEIRADLQTLAAGYAAYVDVLKDIDLEAGQVPSGEDLQKLQEALASIDQPELQAASARISAWAQTNCPGG